MGVCSRCQEPLPGGQEGLCTHCTVLTESGAGGEAETLLPAVKQGDVIAGQWRLERKLGQGGMATVLLAHDLALDRKVAVKLLADHLSGSELSLERFEREARLTAGFDHPNIVAIYGVGRHERRPYIVMKYLDGSPLSRLPPGRLEVHRAVHAFEQLCSGLGYIHGRGFVHRDVKPANVFLSLSGHVTLLDFGILKDLSGQDTTSGLVLGTLPYMAPEQLLGVKNIDHRADLYAAGVLLYELLTGTQPFAKLDGSILEHVRARSRLPEMKDARLSEPWSRVFARALAVAPEERFASARELAAAVREALEAPSGAARAQQAPAPRREQNVQTVSLHPTPAPAPASATSPAPAPVRALRRKPLAVSLLIVLALVGGGMLFVRGVRSHPPAPAVSLTAAPGAVAIAPTPLGAPDLKVPAAAAEPRAPEPASKPASKPAAGGSGVSRTVRPHRPGTLQILTLSEGRPRWASLLVDGQHQGTTPVSLSLEPGRHHVRLERQGTRAVERVVEVVSGRTSTLRIELHP